MYWSGHDSTTPVEALMDIRDKTINLLDQTILNIDSKQNVRPIFEENILKIKNIKLSTLLKEFNAIKNSAPNSAASIFRTILSLVISLRFKTTDSTSKYALRDDISFERDIKEAISEEIFSTAETKLLKRYLNGGKKDSCDNVVHKTVENALINKDDLEDMVDLLNSLLPTIF